jgi:hypothetical protein
MAKIPKIEEELKVNAATMHLQENVAKWWQAYQQSNKIPSWNAFCSGALQVWCR